jgi:hypothetical protein
VGLLLGLEFSLVTYVAPAYPDVLALPTPTISYEEGTPEILSSTVQPGETAEPTPVGLNPLASDGCVLGKLEWISPEAGSEIRGTTDMIVTVQFDDLAFFKYEYSQAGSDIWTTIAASDSAAVEKELTQWNTVSIVPGDYHLRLVVINRENQTLPTCEIPITILAEEE